MLQLKTLNKKVLEYSVMNNSINSMIDTIEKKTLYNGTYTGRRAIDQRIIIAMRDIDRVLYVPSYIKEQAYFDSPLPIGYGQTISQPYIVALMTDLADTSEDSIVLEVGTGSGYQAAILSRLVKQVYSIENIPALANACRQNFHEIGYDNIEVLCSNGYFGWQEKAPFDAIIVTAAASHIPPSLIEQLKPAGKMVIPIGEPLMPQKLMLVSKDENCNTNIKSIIPVSFVPLIMDETEVAN